MSDKGFLDRWSRLKRIADSERDAAETMSPHGDEAAPTDDDAGHDAEVPDLPPLDSMTADTPLTPFFQQGVPASIRNAALRRMWLLDPAIRDHLDVAVDYAWNWNVPGGVPGHGGAIARGAVQRLLDGLTAAPGQPEAPPVRQDDDATMAAQIDQTPAAVPEASQAAAEAEDAPLPRACRHGGAQPV